MELSRRTLLKAGLVGGAGAALSQVPRLVPGGAPTLDQLAASDLHRDTPEEWAPSVCAACAAACPLTLRRIGGRIVGVRPQTSGACARAYTIPQEIVHPDRVRTPLKRTGDRGQGAFQPLQPEDALQEVADLLRRDGRKTAIVVRESAALSLALLQALGHAIGAAHVLTAEWTLSQGPVDALEEATGWRHWHADLANADGVISFGWDWLQAHPHPLEAHRAFARLREKGAPLFFVGPRLNLTAMRSHEWIPCRPGCEPLAALCLAHLLLTENGGPGRTGPPLAPGWEALNGGLQRIDLADAERTTGVPVQRLREVARVIVGHPREGGAGMRRPSLCLGPRGRLQDQWAVIALNALLGNVRRAAGGLTPVPEITLVSPRISPSSAAAPPLSLDDLPEAIVRGRDVEAIVLVGVNPAFLSPAPARWREALRRARHVVCFTSFMDETATFADLVVPLALPAESPDLYLIPVSEEPEPKPAGQEGNERAAVSPPVPTATQPVRAIDAAVPPPPGVLSPADLAFELRKRLDIPEAVFPWKRMTDAARAVTVRRPAVSAFRVPPSALGWTPPAFTEGDFHLLLDTPVTLPRGEGGHLPYLLTTVGPHLREWWTTWVEIHPDTARRLGLRDRDEVIVESTAGAVRARVKAFAGVPPDAVGMAVGVGHRIGQFAQKEGGNPVELIEWRQDRETRTPLWSVQKVKIRRA